MSLDKAIAHGKERRAPYKGARSITTSCRNHGSCSYCERNRRIAERRLAELVRTQEPAQAGAGEN